jgi:hypothetical protein
MVRIHLGPPPKNKKSSLVELFCFLIRRGTRREALWFDAALAAHVEETTFREVIHLGPPDKN